MSEADIVREQCISIRTERRNCSTHFLVLADDVFKELRADTGVVASLLEVYTVYLSPLHLRWSVCWVHLGDRRSINGYARSLEG